MRTDEKEESKYSEISKILDKTGELAALLKDSILYQNYCEKLAVLKKNPALYEQLNIFRRKNMELQIQDCSDREDDAEKLQKQYMNILMEPVVAEFLLSEQAVCQMLREMYNVLYKGIYLDISYMNE